MLKFRSAKDLMTSKKRVEYEQMLSNRSNDLESKVLGDSRKLKVFRFMLLEAAEQCKKFYINNFRLVKILDYLALASFDRIRDNKFFKINCKNNRELSKLILQFHCCEKTFSINGLMIPSNFKLLIKSLEIHLLSTRAYALHLDDSDIEGLFDALEGSWSPAFLASYLEYIFGRLQFCTSSERPKLFRNLSNALNFLFPSYPSRFFLDNANIYLSIIKLIEYCYNLKIKKSRFIVSLVMRLLRGSMPLNPITLSLELLNYILCAVNERKLNMVAYESEFIESPTLVLSESKFSAFSQAFSILNAYRNEDFERTLLLLQHGCEVFVNDFIVSDQNLGIFEFLKQLYYSKIVKKHVFITLVAIAFHKFTKKQMEIFYLIWKTVPQPFMHVEDIKKLKDVVSRRLGNVSRFSYYLSALSTLYGVYFCECISLSRRPRELKHLCRCAIREALKRNFYLPRGISRLKLSSHLENYLNLVI